MYVQFITHWYKQNIEKKMHVKFIKHDVTHYKTIVLLCNQFFVWIIKTSCRNHSKYKR